MPQKLDTIIADGEAYESALPEDTVDHEAEEAKSREQAELKRAALETMLQRRLKVAIDARQASGIEQIWQEDQDQYDGYDDLNPPEGHTQTTSKERLPEVSGVGRRQAGGRSRVFLNITKPKTDTAYSRVVEMAVPTDDRPWAYEPTPVPEIDQAVANKDETPVKLGDGSQVPAKDAALALQVRAKESAKRMQDHVDDWFVEGQVYGEIRKAFRDASRIGTGVLKGPMPVIRQDRKWEQDPESGLRVLSITERLAPTSKAISCWDLFPDPAVTESIHDGSYLWERDSLTARQLRELAKMDGYDKEEIACILKEGPLRPNEYSNRFERSRQGQNNQIDSETYEVYYYWGDIDAETLIAGDFVVVGVLDAESQDDPESAAKRAEQAMKLLELVTIPIVATMINGRVVRIAANPLETGAFPFDVFPWEPVDGQIWGRGVPRKMGVAQRMLNAATRAMLENAGMAAGPQIVAMRDIITPADKSANINGRKLWWFDPQDDIKDVRQAFQVFTIEPIQQHLQGIIEFAMQMADQLSNLPLLLQGAQGQAPDTVGGMAMLQANATSPLKAIAKIADDFLFVPHLTRYYDWGMQDPNVPEDAKGDMQIKARAASALVYRDFLAAFLPQLMPFVKDPAFKIDPEKYLEELLRSNRVSPEQMKLTSEQQAQMAEQAQNVPPDPRIAAAQIKAQNDQQILQAELADKQQQREFEAAEAERDRQIDMLTTQMELEIQVLETAGQKEISTDQLKAMLAKTAADLRSKERLFLAERQFAVSQGNGRGL